MIKKLIKIDIQYRGNQLEMVMRNLKERKALKEFGVEGRRANKARGETMARRSRYLDLGVFFTKCQTKKTKRLALLTLRQEMWRKLCIIYIFTKQVTSTSRP